MTVLFQNVIPDSPTLEWALLIAVSALVSAVIFLYKELSATRKEINVMRDRHEERILVSAKDTRGLLERVLISFSEVEKNIIATDNSHLESLKDIMLKCADKLEQKLDNSINNEK